MFVANVAEDNRGNAITTGGVGHVPSKTSLGNIFASNIARNNAGHNGGQCALPTPLPAHRRKQPSASPPAADPRAESHAPRYDVHHGATLGDFWTDNHAEAEEAVPVYAAVPENSSETVIFEPTPLADPADQP